MFKSLVGNFDNPEVHELLSKHFVELRAARPDRALDEWWAYADRDFQHAGLTAKSAAGILQPQLLRHGEP